jgi:membrane protease YdiL (CAAX protease family)
LLHAARPGWPEIAVGLLVLGVVGIGGGVVIARLPLEPITIGLIFTALSGIACLAGFLAALLLRIRSWQAFGVRATSVRWLVLGAGAGALAFVLKGVAILAYISLTGDNTNPQLIFATGASGGLWTIVAATFFLSVVTPIGEEFLFRGVITSALLRYGAFTGIVGGALLFAISHGINVVFPAALVAGLAAGEVFRRSGSI